MAFLLVSWVSLDYKMGGLELILFKVLSCLEAIAFFLNLPDAIFKILAE